jgi:D-glycero-D-manno-heptose 1,7-bisphosphate phosphatase
VVAGGARRAVFLDRDGVVNRAVVRDGKPFAPASVGELDFETGALEWLPRLKHLGFLLIVVTNQPEVGRGTLSREAVEQIHRALQRALPLDGFYVCWHRGDENCECRKPRPGLILEAAREAGIVLAKSFLIGDRWRDVDAGYNAGVRTVWIDRGYAERAPDHQASAIVGSVEEAVRWIEARVRESAASATLFA